MFGFRKRVRLISGDISGVVYFVRIRPVRIVAVGRLDRYGVAVSGIVPGNDDFGIVRIVIIVVVVRNVRSLVVDRGGVLLVGFEIEIPVACRSRAVKVANSQNHALRIARKGYGDGVRIRGRYRVVGDSGNQCRIGFFNTQSRPVRDLVHMGDQFVPSCGRNRRSASRSRKRSQARAVRNRRPGKSHGD